MFKDSIYRFMRGWNFLRILRLALGIFIIIQGIQSGEWKLLLLGGLFSLMPLFNMGCCAAGNCSVPSRPKKADTSKDLVYEEVW